MSEEEIIDAEVIETVNQEMVDNVKSLYNMDKIYLSGPMTGIEDYNYPLFNKVAEEFRNANFAVCNPAEFFDGKGDRERKEYMRESVKYLLEADTIILLPGWEKSKGARLECMIAQELDLNIVEYVDHDGGFVEEPEVQEDTTPRVVGKDAVVTPVGESESLGTLTSVDGGKKVEVTLTPVEINEEGQEVISSTQWSFKSLGNTTEGLADK